MNEQQKYAFADQQKIDTVKALIEVYKQEFGPEWQSAFISTLSGVCNANLPTSDGLLVGI